MTSPVDEKKRNGEQAGHVIVVGPCAAGKTTLVRRLREIGYDAQVCAQEHSDIPGLWRRSSPAATLALDLDIEALRRRRDEHRSELILARQRARLAHAFAGATAKIDTSDLSPTEVLTRATAALRAAGITPTHATGECS
jgi:GTPase SAR1 family protein